MARQAVRPRSGLSMAEVLTAVAIMAVMSAAVVPTVMSRFTAAGGQSLANEFGTLAAAINSYHDNVGKYPPSLDYLTTLPTSSQKDVCAQALSTQAVNQWRGPYVSRLIPARTGIDFYLENGDTINEDVVRTPTAQNNSSTNYIVITARNVDSATASAAKQAIDALPISNTTTGNVIWLGGTSSRGNLTYRVPVWGC